MTLQMAKKKARFPKHPFDVEHGTDTGGLTPGVELKTGHENDRHNTAYYGIAPSLFRRFVTQWRKLPPPHRLSSYSFIDIGAGKGRAMLLASEFNFREVVISGAEKYPLRNTTMGADGNRLKIQNEYFLAHPGIIPDSKLPRKMDVHSRLDIDLLANLCAKNSQQRRFESRRPWKR